MVIEEWLRPDVARALLAEFPRAKNEATYDHVRDWGKTARLVDDLLASAPFIAWLSSLTKIQYLVHDPSYSHAGMRISPTGGPWEVGPHELGWHRRICVVINLTPGWIERWGAAPTRANRSALSNRCSIFEADDHSLHGFGLTGGQIETDPARVLQAYYYERRRPTREAPVKERRKPRSIEIEPVPAALSAKASVEEQRQAAWQAFENNIESLRALLEDEIARARAIASSLHRSFDDGSAPLLAAEHSAWRSVFERQADLAKHLAEHPQHAAQMRASVAFPPLPESPAGTVLSHSGFWRDRWVAMTCRLVLAACKEPRVLEIDGYLPARLAGQELTCRVLGTSSRSASFGQGPFTWRIPVPANREPTAVEISADRTYRPHAEAESADSRELAWHLVKLRIA